MPQSNPMAGEVYRHSKGKMYKVQGIAVHFETGEAMVIYQEMCGDNITYVRPYESFIENFTFTPTGVQTDDTPTEKEPQESPMLRFLDTDDFDEKYEILCNIPKADIDDVLVDNLAVTLDVVIPDGPIEQRFAELKTCVRTRKKYESLRLR